VLPKAFGNSMVEGHAKRKLTNSAYISNSFIDVLHIDEIRRQMFSFRPFVFTLQGLWLTLSQLTHRSVKYIIQTYRYHTLYVNYQQQVICCRRWSIVVELDSSSG
jgi:hypothetical protein